MNNIAMNNETDLDWLARNVHEWREGANYICVNHTDGGYVFHEHNRNCAVWFTRDQWLSRRAELQNKPSWADAPEWAQWLVQDEDGVWYWHGKQPKPKGGTVNGEKYWMSCGESMPDGRGELLGDWRDTLERRPEEFKPFTSIEDNQEKAMKQDNGWHERGELPPVGTVCLYAVSDRCSAEVEITAHAKLGLCFVEVGKSGENYVSKTAELHRFRPIRTEREVLIEHMQSDIAERWANCEELATHLVDKGWVKESK